MADNVLESTGKDLRSTSKSPKRMVKYETRVLLLHYWKKNVNAVETTRQICETEGKDAVAVRTTQRWFLKFASGDTNLKDKPRSGRPSGATSKRVNAGAAAAGATSAAKLTAANSGDRPGGGTSKATHSGANSEVTEDENMSSPMHELAVEAGLETVLQEWLAAQIKRP
ncbi:unnamed protein product [Bursaphelenchus okinawaensis]|uniref:Mos1 transposase HTH domain-containing protein n=1 Tax=Bursaphelenchus okinawaensis TaxID=465554 RepID=A0A811JUZ4_9BILA|nr:unnamed protein product [Bursaphelenchus okinawaensis]CAG9084281.1 unnamed protein product [Bursaphelenchus okinawaensis]